MEERSIREERARKRIKDIKGFYSHLTVYVFVNIILQLFYAGVFDNGSFTGYIPFWVRFTTPGFWGLSLLIHYIVVFHGNFFSKFYKKWEERKIQEYMAKEEKELDQRWR
mgnify:CR=1 FL=1